MRGIDPNGPAAGRLQEGDALVAVNGTLITTPAGGRALAALGTDRGATLTIRRSERLLTVSLQPVGACQPPLLIVGNTVLAGASVRSEYTGRLGGGAATTIDLTMPEPRGPTAMDLSVGMALRCAGCELVITADGSGRWNVRDYPTVELVKRNGVAEEAGLRPGDEVRTIEGQDLRSESGGRLLYALPGGDFRLGYIRNGRTATTVLNRRIVDQRVEVRRDRIQSIRVERSGDRWGDKLLAALTRFWRELRDFANDSRVVIQLGGNRPSATWTVRGDSWGPASLGLLFESAGGRLFEGRVVDGRREYSLPSAPVVAYVVQEGPGAAAGFEPGDVLLRINDLDVLETEGTRLLFFSSHDRPLDITYRRNGTERHATVVPRETP